MVLDDYSALAGKILKLAKTCSGPNNVRVWLEDAAGKLDAYTRPPLWDKQKRQNAKDNLQQCREYLKGLLGQVEDCFDELERISKAQDKGDY
jgi:hypothetical protein